jgi:hypothetical protein
MNPLNPEETMFSDYNKTYAEMQLSNEKQDFIKLKANTTTDISNILANLDLWENIKVFADIGGSSGFLARKICKANPHL